MQYFHKVFEAVLKERERQDGKWGDQSHKPDEVWHLILQEEAGEVAKAILDGDREEMSMELIQVAAVAVAHLEALCKRGHSIKQPE